MVSICNLDNVQTKIVNRLHETPKITLIRRNMINEAGWVGGDILIVTRNDDTGI